MILKASNGLPVSFTDENGKSIFDKTGQEWARHPSGDKPGESACYMNTKTFAQVLLTREDLKRVIAGPNAMRTPTTLDEMRDYVDRCPKYIRDVADNWPDQKLRQILYEAEEHGSNPGWLLERMVDKQREPEPIPETPTEAPGEDTEEHRAPRTARSTPRPRKQEGSVSVTLGEASVLLTPKQLEFMERLSECPGWNEGGPAGEYTASEYAQELSDTMNPMSMGAVLTTLREKHLLQTDKRRVGAIKCCVFKLTDLGVQVYNKLAEASTGGNGNA